MIAIGIDLGGTKIATQIFDANWHCQAQHRIATPTTYPALLAALAEQVAWARTFDPQSVVGLGTAGLQDPATGLLHAANLCADQQTLAADLRQKLDGTPITALNDAQAFALSEATFGAGRGARRVFGLTLGTGLGGGLVLDGKLPAPASGLGGEIGHMAAPAHVIAAHDLPIRPCPCGRAGCLERYVAGPGLSFLAQHFTGETLTPAEVIAQRTDSTAQVWQVWLSFLSEALHTITLCCDPGIIVLGGGLSKVEGLIDALNRTREDHQLAGLAGPPVSIAQGGDDSGARGAALAAYLTHKEAKV